MKMDKKNYFLGFDIGTESVGWAVTDEQYNLDKVRGQNLWGVYLFDKANSKQERRTFRSARRRVARVRQRINILQSLFAEEIEKIDPTFFMRLNNSKLFLEDKDDGINTKNILFDDAGYIDKDFFKKYRTIFHLRKALMSESVGDIRHLYLAIHHIIKNRGHFLFEGQEFTIGSTELAKSAITTINAWFADRELEAFNLEKIDEALEVIKDKTKKINDAKKQLKELLSIPQKENAHLLAAISLMLGGKAKLKDLYSLEDCDVSFDFKSADFDIKERVEIENVVGADEMELIDALKSIYDWAMLCEILQDSVSVSEAKVKSYEEHKSDLALLKNYVKTNCPEKYKQVFRYQSGVANYAAYVGMDYRKRNKVVSRDDFYKYLKNTLKVDDERILQRIESGQFMPKQISGFNTVIPYQLHLFELDRILTVAGEKYTFLKNKENGVSVSDKIKMLMKFRVPYFVGPLGGGVHSWAVRYQGKERQKVTPWNFEEIVDLEATEEKFIRNMTVKCTYLKTEDVLPKSSLLYSEYMFLNELNNLTVYGQKDERARQLIYEYAKTHKKVTLKNCLSLLIREGIVEKGADIKQVFGGLDEDFKSNLSSFNTFNNILNGNAEKEWEMCEDIIRLITIISDKDRLIKRVKERYGDKLNEEQLKRIKALNYTAWGRLSATLLQEIKSDKFIDEETGELQSIIDVMKSRPLNFMQLLANGNGFSTAIEEFNNEHSVEEKITYKTVEALYCSPLVKRAIWRTVVLAKEIEKIKGKAPEKIFIEMARGTEENKKGKRTISRKEQLKSLYISIKDDLRNWVDEIDGIDDRKFISDKVYLYYQQKGTCVYTGEKIPFEQIFNTNIWDIDHIYPQSKIKDDSLDNRVLVKKDYNQAVKKNIYPLPIETRKAMTPLWTMLLSQGLITKKKFDRLVRSTPLTTDELADFVNRQIIVTQQSTKEVANLLKKLFPDTEIVYSKARLVSDVKDRYGLVKCRELNDLHHAKDAYMNIVVGNVYNVLFQHDARVYYSKAGYRDVNENEIFNRAVDGAWQPEYIDNVKKTYKNDRIRVVRFVNQINGKLFDATIYHDPNKANLIPLKGKGAISDTKKYGGYDSATGAYFVLAKSVGKKGETLLSLEHIPVYLVKRYGENKTAILEYLINNCGLKNPEIVIDKIRKNTLLDINGSKACISGRSDTMILLQNANQLFLEYDLVKYVKKIESFIKKNQKAFDKLNVETEIDKIDADSNIILYDQLTDKLAAPIYKGLSMSGQVKTLREKRDIFIALDLKDQCKVLMQILALLKCDSRKMDLSLLGAGKILGTNRISKFIQDKDIKIIYQSPTGHYRTVIDIKTFL